MDYVVKKKVKKATRAVYIKEDTINNIEKIMTETDMTFSELVNDMLDFCIENKVSKEKSKKKK